MYPATDEEKKLYDAPYKQIIEITLGDTVITEADIVGGSFSLDRYVCTGEKLEIGSAVASEVNFKLSNYDGRFNDLNFGSNEMFIRVGIKKWDADEWEKAEIHWMPIGYFTVDYIPRRKDIIEVSALDRMTRFDKAVNPASISFPISITTLLDKAVQACGVQLKDKTGMANLNYTVKEFPVKDTDLNWRTIIQWIAGISGTNAYIDADGKLNFGWIQQTDYVSAPSNRYDSDIYEDDVEITGIAYTDDENVVHLSGTEGYVFDMSSNLLIQDNVASALNALGSKLNGFKYRPFKATCRGVPYLMPMDGIVVKDRKGQPYSTMLTHVNWQLNGSTILRASGLTQKANNQAQNTTFSPSQLKHIEKSRKQTDGYIKASFDVFEDSILGRIVAVKSEVETGVDVKLGDYYKKTETLNTNQIEQKITDSENTINLEVAKKVGADEIISKINMSPGDVAINADKINLNGAVTANDNFKILTDGSIAAKNGTFSGNIEGSDITGSTFTAFDYSDGQQAYTAMVNGTGFHYFSGVDNERGGAFSCTNSAKGTQSQLLSTQLGLFSNIGSSRWTTMLAVPAVVDNLFSPLWIQRYDKTSQTNKTYSAILSPKDPVIFDFLSNNQAYLKIDILPNFTTGGKYKIAAEVDSDIRLKRNIKDTEVSALEIIRKMNLHQFDWKEREGHVDLGFVAQELEELDECFVLKPENEDDFYAVNSNGFTPYFAKALQELDEKNRKLEERIRELEKKGSESWWQRLRMKLHSMWQKITS